MLDTLIKRGETIVNAITLVIVIVIAVVGYKVIVAVRDLFTSDTEFSQFAWARVEGAAENDALVTGMLAIDMLWMKADDEWFSLADILSKADNVPPTLLADVHDEPTRESRGRGPMAYCAHSYELVIGYPSFKSLRDGLETAVDAAQAGSEPPAIEAPRIIALNVVASRANPPELTEACMLKNQVGDEREATEEALWDVMGYDGVADLHSRQGQLGAVALLDSLSGACDLPQQGLPSEAGADTAGGRSKLDSICWRDALEEQWRRQGGNAFSNRNIGLASEAAIGAVQVTISTLFGMDTAWRPWYWFDREGVYLQRDVTRIVYGSPVAPLATLLPVFGQQSARLVMRRPGELSRDRQTTFVVQTGEQVWRRVVQDKTDNLGAYVTTQINSAVSGAESKIRTRAIASAEALIRQRLSNWFEGSVSVEFRDGEDAPNDALSILPGDSG